MNEKNNLENDLDPEVIKVRDKIITKIGDKPLEEVNSIIKKLLNEQMDEVTRIGALAARLKIIRSKIDLLYERKVKINKEPVSKPTPEKKEDKVTVEEQWVRVKMVETGDVNGKQIDKGVVLDVKEDDAQKLIDAKKAVLDVEKAKKEETVESKTEEQNELKKEETVESKTKETVESKTKETVESKTVETVESKTEEKPESKAEQQSQLKTEETVEKKNDQEVAQENKATEKKEDSMEKNSTDEKKEDQVGKKDLLELHKEKEDQKDSDEVDKNNTEQTSESTSQANTSDQKSEQSSETDNELSSNEKK